ncbi:MAG TPA: tripartite tricarboxylate transporter substrate binding protein, partial [Burkholderiales bacterium]|nr:tripartite tricarboxylate transporter substrate binding protein [Burkholderiales bacterium]
MTPPCRFCLLVAALLSISLAASLAPAADWPEKPVRIIVPYAAGGNSDLIARQTAQVLSEAFGRQFIADNRPG